MLSGETAETGDGGSLHALLQGTRTGAAIALVKVYDDGHQTPIAYTGTANDDSSEIIGRWSIAGQWSGTFIMVRRPDASAKINVRIAETVGRADRQGVVQGQSVSVRVTSGARSQKKNKQT